MRIIAGKYRRRKLQTNPGLVTRPITDRAKEILFERLGDILSDCRVADVFAGTGTLGLEALSRGAAGVVFIEQDHLAHDLLKRNVAMLGIEQEALCWRTDVFRTSFRPKGVPHLLPYDVVFFDPPYRLIAGLQAGAPLYKSLERLARDGVTAEGALLIIRAEADEAFDYPPIWQREREMRVSSMAFHLFRKCQEAADG
jgi:16S rRNA (guanine966-N2)-methyltransferase